MKRNLKAKHTPGPWKFFHDQRHGESGNLHADLFIIESDTRKSMATLEVWALNADPKWRKAHPEVIKERAQTLVEVKANAYLIAAAPDLLAALQSLMSPNYGTGNQYDDDNAREEARAAIAKATQS
jgi:hypothetical protein